jgi:PPM family protein phosphatase
MKIESCILTNKGKVRAANEDSFASSEKDNIWIVCDGMGGGVAGKFASEITANTVLSHINGAGSPRYSQLRGFYDKNLPLESIYLAESIQLANRLLFNLSIEYPRLQGMGTTVCSLYINNNVAYLAHAGDSRIYSFKNTKIHLLTRDHSFVQELLEDKEISKKEAAKFKQKNVITRALGVNYSCDLDVYIQPITSYTKYFLLCTDGLWNVLGENEMETTIMSGNGSLDQVCASLIDQANAKGGPDNITVALIRVTEHDKPKTGFGSIYDKVITVSNKDKAFLREQDKLLAEVIPSVKSLLPPEAQEDRRRELITNILIYAALTVVIVGILLFIKLKLSMMQVAP